MKIGMPDWIYDAPDWIHHVDWGTAPAWLTFGVAGVVAYYSVPSARSATKAYVDNTWERKVSAARLTYASQLGFAHMPTGKQLKGLWSGISNRRVLVPSSVTRGPVHGSDAAAVPLGAFKVSVHNSSKEPMTNVSLMILGADGKALVDDAAVQLGVLQPESVGEAVVFFPAELPTGDVPYRLRLHFRDSSGVAWSRVEAEPPEPVVKPQPERDRRLRLPGKRRGKPGTGRD